MKLHPAISFKEILRRRFPIVEWLPYYSWSKLLHDSLAGTTVGLTVIPQGIAYAIVAGLPAQVSFALYKYVSSDASVSISILYKPLLFSSLCFWPGTLIK